MTETLKKYLIQAGLAVALIAATALTTVGVVNKVKTGSFFHMPKSSVVEETIEDVADGEV